LFVIGFSEEIMKKTSSFFIGIGLVLLGGLALMGNFTVSLLGFEFQMLPFWRLWPVIVLGMGIALALPAVFIRGERWPGILFIPALPIFITGGILMTGSLFDAWEIWAYLWPLEVLALALGFAFAALYTRSYWFLIPTILIGLNGLVLQFCTVTGLWEAWSVLWTIEPLAIGMILLLVGVLTNTKPVVAIGLITCGFAAAAAMGMLVLLSVGPWAFRYIVPLGLIGVGVLVLLASFLGRPGEPNQIPGEGTV
jgi:hypothetical protein